MPSKALITLTINQPKTVMACLALSAAVFLGPKIFDQVRGWKSKQVQEEPKVNERANVAAIGGVVVDESVQENEEEEDQEERLEGAAQGSPPPASSPPAPPRCWSRTPGGGLRLNNI